MIGNVIEKDLSNHTLKLQITGHIYLTNENEKLFLFTQEELEKLLEKSKIEERNYIILHIQKRNKL